MLPLVKAHAYGNDFLLAPRAAAIATGVAPADLARGVCGRHTGIGADGLILFEPTPTGARMTLLNADGSPAEVSGNGVRCLAALRAHELSLEPGGSSLLVIETDAGPKELTLLEREGRRARFRAHMGQPERVRRVRVEIPGEPGGVDLVAMTFGNPQCVALGGDLTTERLARVGPGVQSHPEFPEGTNVELAKVEAPDRVRILIWERGVGPTQSSGTGSCAAAIAAASFGGARRTVEVHAPGGAQRVEWHDDGVYLTGWAEVVLEGHWTA